MNIISIGKKKFIKQATCFKSKTIARKTLRTLENILTVITVSGKSVSLDLDSRFSDFEDALQYFSCLEANADYIISRNSKDYRYSKIPVLSGQHFLDLYHSK